MTDQKPEAPRPADRLSAERLVTATASRRQILKAGAAMGVGAIATQILAACAPATASSAPTAAASSAPPASTGPAPSASTASEPSLDPSKTVRIWIQNYGDPKQQADALATIATAFKEATGVTVAFEGLDWATAEQKWDLAMTSGDLPDIGDMFYLPSRIVQGQGKWGPVDLTSRIDAGDFGDWNRIVKASRDESTIDGKVYGIPWRIDIRAWTGRSDMFPSVPKTIQELESMGLEVLKKAGIQTATDPLRPAGGRPPPGRSRVRDHVPLTRLQDVKPARPEVGRRRELDARPEQQEGLQRTVRGRPEVQPERVVLQRHHRGRIWQRNDDQRGEGRRAPGGSRDGFGPAARRAPPAFRGPTAAARSGPSLRTHRRSRRPRRSWRG